MGFPVGYHVRTLHQVLITFSIVILSVASETFGKSLFIDYQDIIINLDPSAFQVFGPSVRYRQSDLLTFVNFHSSSCPHCISHAPTWIEFAKALQTPKAAVAALDCDEYRDLCSALKINFTPAIKVFEHGNLIRENIGEELKDLFKLAKDVYKLPLNILTTKARAAEKALLVTANLVDSKITTSDDDDKPEKPRLRASANGDQDDTTTQSSSRKGVSVKSSIKRDLRLQKEETKSSGNVSPSKRPNLPENPKLRVLHDASLSLRYGLEKGVFLGRFVLAPQEQEALLNWLDFLRRAFPTKTGRWHLDWLYQRTKAITDKEPLTSRVFDELLLGWGFARRFNEEYEWQFCARSDTGSITKPEAGSGYTCGLWLLFHTLSISAARSPHLFKEVDASAALHGFVKHFFSCNECRENFLKHNPAPFKSDSGDHFGFALWLWKEHNSVSNRLNFEDKQGGIIRAPRDMFPPLEGCSTCRQVKPDGTFDFVESVVVRYLDHAYSGFPESEELPFTETVAAGFGGSDGLSISSAAFAYSAITKMIFNSYFWIATIVIVICCLIGKNRRRRLMAKFKRSKH